MGGDEARNHVNHLGGGGSRGMRPQENFGFIEFQNKISHLMTFIFKLIYPAET